MKKNINKMPNNYFKILNYLVSKYTFIERPILFSNYQIIKDFFLNDKYPALEIYGIRSWHKVMEGNWPQIFSLRW